MRFGLSPDSNSLMRSSLPATYWSRSSVASCFCCASTIFCNSAICLDNSLSLASVCFCSSARSRRLRLASEIAASDSASASAALLFAVSVLSMLRLSAVSFWRRSARSLSAIFFCLLRSVSFCACAAGSAIASASGRISESNGRIVRTSVRRKAIDIGTELIWPVLLRQALRPVRRDSSGGSASGWHRVHRR